MNPAGELKARMRADLLEALKGKRSDEVSLLRSLIAAVDNAEAPALGTQLDRDGPGEIDRLSLSSGDLDAVLAAEIRSREDSAAELTRVGQNERAGALLTQAQRIAIYLTPR